MGNIHSQISELKAPVVLPPALVLGSIAAAVAFREGYRRRDEGTSLRTGIISMEAYIPSYAARLNSKSVSDSESEGNIISFTGDREDLTSMALTVATSLFEKYAISTSTIGYVVVAIGSNTTCSSTAISTSLIQRLFQKDDIVEGNTISNGKLSGTNALHDAVRWVNNSPARNAKNALVVVVDINMPTKEFASVSTDNGCAAVAMLVGRNAALVVDTINRSVVGNYCYSDSGKLIGSSVDITRSFVTNLCEGYKRFADQCNTSDSKIDHVVLRSLSTSAAAEANEQLQLCDTPKRLLTKCMLHGDDCDMLRQVGDTGATNLFLNLALLISDYGDKLQNQSILLGDFSIIGGAAFTLLKPGREEMSKAELATMKNMLDLRNRVKDREFWDADSVTAAIKCNIELSSGMSQAPVFDTLGLYPGTYFLSSVDEDMGRHYVRKSLHTPRVEGERPSSTIDNSPVKVTTSTSSILLREMSSGALVEPAPTLRRNTSSYVWASGRNNVNVVISGVAAGLPGRDGAVFPLDNTTPPNIERIIMGQNLITPIPDAVKDSMLEKHVALLSKGEDGKNKKTFVKRYAQSINVCASLGDFDLTRYGVSESIASTMDRAVQVSVAAGLEALRDAGIVTGKGDGLDGWVLPESMQETTGVVYATSFPALDTAISEVSKYFLSKLTEKDKLVPAVVESLRLRLLSRLSDNEVTTGGTLPGPVESALQELHQYMEQVAAKDEDSAQQYEFDRKFLFRVLVLGNAQLAQIVKARGPNMQTNAACAGSTQAVAFAYDMIQLGRAERMIVIAGDSASSDNLMPWLGNGFLALGAATTQAEVQMAALPFDRRRTGMILGSGGIGMVLESEAGARRRHVAMQRKTPFLAAARPHPFKCRILGTLYSNSAFHGAALDRKHIAEEFERFISSVEEERGITRKDIAKYGVYFSHETSTHASPTSSCAANEVFALRKVFGEDVKDLLILNTKGLTGHPMGVSFEDVVAAEVLFTGRVPPVANLQEPDPYLGLDLKYSRGGTYECRYALRFAAGFGSQIAIALYGK